MKKIIGKIRLGALIFAFLELAFLLTLALFYGFDWYNFRFFFGLEYIIALIAVWGALNLMFVLISLAVVGRHGKKPIESGRNHRHRHQEAI
jgi:hypothetical protein